VNPELTRILFELQQRWLYSARVLLAVAAHCSKKRRCSCSTTVAHKIRILPVVLYAVFFQKNLAVILQENA